MALLSNLTRAIFSPEISPPMIFDLVVIAMPIPAKKTNVAAAFPSKTEAILFSI